MYGLLLVGVTLLGLPACDDDDPGDVADDCSREAAFVVDGDAICATGTSNTNTFGTTLSLTGENNESLVIVTTATSTGTYDVGLNGAYTDRAGVQYGSTEGSITYDDIDGAAEGSFNMIVVSDDNVRLEIENGVFENL